MMSYRSPSETLRRAADVAALRLVHDGASLNASVLKALARRGLLERREAKWQLTQEGHIELLFASAH
jgi:hypothetical protein